MTLVIYTALFDAYDTLHDPLVSHPDIAFIYVSEQPIDGLSTWTYRPPLTIEDTPAASNRYHKMHPHRLFQSDAFTHSMYIDANIFITHNDLLNHARRCMMASVPIALVTHPNRYCCYQELARVYQSKQISTSEFTQSQSFLAASFPEKNKGLYEANLIFRDHHNPNVQSAMEHWWSLYHSLCRRDQVTLPYILQTHHLHPTLLFDSPHITTRNSAACLVTTHKKASKKHRTDPSLLNPNYIVNELSIPLRIALGESQTLGYCAHITQPRTFNEHILHLMANNTSSFQTKLSDKLALKDYVDTLPFNIKTPQTYHTATTIDDLLMHDYPAPFYIKANHSSGDTWLIHDKHCITDRMKQTMNQSIQTNYGIKTAQPNYIQIPRFLFAEESLGESIPAYNVLVFNGTPKLIQIDINEHPHHTQAIYCPKWEKQPFSIGQPMHAHPIDRPKNLSLMLDIAAYIGAFFDFIRVDIYATNGDLFLKGVTFFPGGGCEPFSTIAYDYIVGQYFK